MEKRAANIKITWEGPEFIFSPKGSNWYWGIALAALAIIGIFVWQQLYFSAGIALLCAAVLFITAKQEPRMIEYQLDENGLTFHEKTHNFEQFKSFWLTEQDMHTTLYLEKTKKLSMPLSIFIERINPAPIREFLLKHLPEKENGTDTINESLSKYL